VSEVVTGEAVVLDVRPASFASRAVSGALDLLVAAVLLVICFAVGVNLFQGLDTATAAALSLVLTLAITIGVPTVVETLTRGRTLGKLAMGLRVVRDDGGPIRLRFALTRALIGFVEIYLMFGMPALITSLVSSRGKRLGDVAAGTYVVRDRAGRVSEPMAQMPPWLVGWAQTADIARLPDGMALSVRQFLGRANGLNPQSRQHLGTSLAQAVSPYVAPPPPPGTHPEAFLSAVLAERRRRDVIRLAREQQARDRLAGVDSVEAALAAVRLP
jgi:uncharacterized RDD family membrane protein YckC